MNIECQNSFDANLKIRVSTPSGQKDLNIKSQNQSRTQAPTPGFEPTPPPPDVLDDNTSSWVAYPSQDLPYQYQLPLLNPTFGQELPSLHPPTTSSSFSSDTMVLDSWQCLGPWDLRNPSFNHPYPHGAVDVFGAQGANPAYFSMPSLEPPTHQHLEPIPSWETAPFPSCQGTEKYREEWWVPGIAATSGRTS